MIQPLMTCSMCGHSFDPTLYTTCQACPLMKNCNLVCCPQCGFEMVDIQQSKLVRMISHLFPKAKPVSNIGGPNLAGIRPGQQARVIGFANTIPTEKQTHLQSFGLIPGRIIRVKQHSPVTVIQIEHTELAFEREIASEIQVEIL